MHIREKLVKKRNKKASIFFQNSLFFVAKSKEKFAKIHNKAGGVIR